MKLRISLVKCLGLGIALSFGVAQALELDIRTEKSRVTYTVNPDATYIMHVFSQNKALTESGVDALKRDSITHSASVESSKILQAYTLKADGSKIEVPKDNYQTTVNAGLTGKPAFSDRASTQIIFPELKIGDSTVMEYEVTTKEPIFPGQFSLWSGFNKHHAYDAASVTVDSPITMPAGYGSNQLKQTVSSKNGRRIITWKYRNPNPPEMERENYSVYEPENEPYLAFTTFKNYQEIAQAYGLRATPKAVPTERVKKLAAELVAGKRTEAEKVRALYDWTARKIDYAGNCIGIGAVVPRDLDFVLDNKMGDCKDHATLLQALLNTQNIASTQVLVNAGSMYSLPKYPVASMVNHVFNYIPSLNLYLDSTSSDTPYGLIPLSVQGKPILAVDGYDANARTPVDQPEVNTEVITSTLKFDDKGNAVGQMKTVYTGHMAAAIRARFRDWKEEDRKKFLKNYFEGMQLKGDGRVSYPDPEPLLPTFEYTYDYTVQQALDEGGAILPYSFISSARPIESYIADAFRDNAEDDKHATACGNGSASATYTITLPNNVEILKLPQDEKVNSAYLDFAASYTLQNQVLKIERKIIDKSPGGVCEPEVGLAYKEPAQTIAKHLRRRILYQMN